MRISKDFLREAIQLVATKRPLIVFEIEEGVADRKLGESWMYKLYTQPEEENSPVLRGQNMGNMDATYTLATFIEQMADNLEHCLKDVTVQ
eukprot:5755901-Ditylum_brightwellii.AAC.1